MSARQCTECVGIDCGENFQLALVFIVHVVFANVVSYIQGATAVHSNDRYQQNTADYHAALSPLFVSVVETVVFFCRLP